jgi:hypothetical protein
VINTPSHHPADWISSGTVDEATCCLLRELLHRAASASGAENTALWLAGEDHLHATLGTGPHADHFVGVFEQPLEKGIISLVHASAQAVCENAIASNPEHSPVLDNKLGIVTDAMIAVPLAVAGEIAGVITCVHTRSADDTAPPSEFRPKDLTEFEFASACCGRILEAAILGAR